MAINLTQTSPISLALSLDAFRHKTTHPVLKFDVKPLLLKGCPKQSQSSPVSLRTYTWYFSRSAKLQYLTCKHATEVNSMWDWNDTRGGRDKDASGIRRIRNPSISQVQQPNAHTCPHAHQTLIFLSTKPSSPLTVTLPADPSPSPCLQTWADASSPCRCFRARSFSNMAAQPTTVACIGSQVLGVYWSHLGVWSLEWLCAIRKTIFGH